MGILTSWFQTRSSHQEPIDILLFRQILAVLLAYGTSIDDSGVLSRFR
jgi:hypothetical protein